MIKTEKGVALATLIITVIVMLTITGTIAYTSTDTMKLRKLDDMYNDIRLLNQKVENYYIENNELPILKDNENMEIEISSEEIQKVIEDTEGKKINPNDNEVYYLIDLEKLGGVTLKYGKQYKEYAEDNNNNDIYIINEDSHTIYYLNGIEINVGENKGKKYTLEGEYSQIFKIPTIYQEVEYIEFTSTQYIDTSYVPNEKTKVEAKLIANKNGALWASEGNSVYSTNFSAQLSSGYANWRFNGKTIDVQLFPNTMYTFIQSKDGLIANGNVLGNYNNYSNFTSKQTLKLGKRENNFFSGNLYYFKIWDNDVLVRDFIPCYRKSDNVIGMYDTVTEAFYTNQGTGTFLKGDNINS